MRKLEKTPRNFDLYFNFIYQSSKNKPKFRLIMKMLLILSVEVSSKENAHEMVKYGNGKNYE